MRSLKIFYAVAISLLIIYLVAEYNKPKPTDWRPTLSYNDKIPFGTYIMYREVKGLFPGAQIKGTNNAFHDQFRDSSAISSNYIIIANEVTFNKYDFAALRKYLEKGNTAFVATSAFPRTVGASRNVLADTLKIETNEYIIKQRITHLNFTNPVLHQTRDYKFDNGIASDYFSRLDTTRAIVLGRNEAGYANFVCYKFGKGSLFLCANPELFTNYSLLTDQGADYAAKALSYMPVKPVIYWDHLQNGDISEDSSPLRVFFSSKSLEWAYYISIAAMVIFILYEMKRRQRIIPVIEPLKNSTVDFVNVVGQVYYEQRNNVNISQKKVLFFLEHLRARYFLKTNILDAGFAEKLSQKTGIEMSFSKDLVGQLNYINSQNHISDNELILLNQLIEQFYIKSGDNGRRII
ncbi:MAG: DUF4350 domain-containing protein [Sphingobacteriales bacterium]